MALLLVIFLLGSLSASFGFLLAGYLSSGRIRGLEARIGELERTIETHLKELSIIFAAFRAMVSAVNDATTLKDAKRAVFMLSDEMFSSVRSQ